MLLGRLIPLRDHENRDDRSRLLSQGRQGAQVAELLAAQGHEVDVLCLREGDEPRAFHHLGVNNPSYQYGTTEGRQTNTASITA